MTYDNSEFMRPPHEDPTRNLYIRDAKLRAKYVGFIVFPLYFLFIPFLLGSIVVHVISGLFKRLWAALSSASPDAGEKNYSRIHPDDIEGRVPSCPIKMANLYVGDIFGYLNVMRGYPLAWHYIKKLGGSKVFAVNMGMPALACFDVASAESVFLGRTALNDTFAPLFRPTLDDSFKNNVLRVGDAAVRFRRLFLSLLPTQIADDAFRNGLKELKDYLSHLSHHVDYKIVSSPLVEDCASKLARRFVSGMLFGGFLDDELMANVQPLIVGLMYPYFPNWLFPQYYKMQASLPALEQQMKSLPRWSEISRLAHREGFSDDYISHALMSVLTINVPGLVNPIANALLLLPLLPKHGKELLADEHLLDSFCWELLRFSSRTFIMPVKSKHSQNDDKDTSGDSTTILSNSGESYRVKNDTLLFTHLPVVMRDEKYWAEPSLFKAGRFRNSSPSSGLHVNKITISKLNTSNEDTCNADGNEPLPTLVFGCPLGSLLNLDELQNGRRCPITLLAHPFMKELVVMLVKNYRWSIDLTSREKLDALKVSKDADSSDLVVDFSLENMKGGFFTAADMIPSLNMKGTRFAHFEEL